MNKQEKINYLWNNHFSKWMKTRIECDQKLSDSQSMICICGRLATGFHERSCRKFQQKVDAMAIEKLKHLLPTKAGKKMMEAKRRKLLEDLAKYLREKYAGVDISKMPNEEIQKVADDFVEKTDDDFVVQISGQNFTIGAKSDFLKKNE